MANGMGRSGIVTRRYKSGSIVYFEGDKSEYIYILKGGRVVLSYLKPETGEEIKEEMRSGEFFGVKSALGKYPREETAQTIGETVVLILTLADFEQLVLGNVQVVKKMLRVFSNQLRRIGKAVREVLGETDSVNPQVELYKLGDYYYRNGKYDQALYAFKKYMEYYPDEKYASQSMQHIEEIESGRAGSAMSSELDFEMGSQFGGAVESEPGFSFDEISSPEISDASGEFDLNSQSLGEQSRINSDMDNFLDDGIGDFIDESIDDIYNDATENITGIYNSARSSFSEGDYDAAVKKYMKILEKTPVDSTEQQYYESSHIELAKTYIKLKKLKDSMTQLFAFTKKYPKSMQLKKCLLEIGNVYNMAGSKDKALAYYKKVAGLPPKDSFSQAALNNINQIK